MKALVKTKLIMVRLRGREATQVERAARIMSKRRGEIVGLSTLVRELAMPGIQKILAEADAEAAARMPA